jgi:hypothetical protein
MQLDKIRNYVKSNFSSKVINNPNDVIFEHYQTIDGIVNQVRASIAHGAKYGLIFVLVNNNGVPQIERHPFNVK